MTVVDRTAAPSTAARPAAIRPAAIRPAAALVARTDPAEAFDPIAVYAAGVEAGLEAALWLRGSEDLALVGLGRAKLLNLGGEPIYAETAYAWGLVEQVVPVEELMAAATSVAASFAARSPHAVAVIRELARTTRDLSLEEGLRREAEGFRRCLLSEDGGEGVAAFVEKREPRFTGR